MADSIRIKRGVKADLPKALPLGELAYCTDTRQLFIGTGNSIAPVKAEEIHFDDLNGRLEVNSQNINKLYKDVDELGSRVSNHNHDDRYYTEEEINSKINTINNNINGKANSNHNHDDRYYTEAEINSKIDNKVTFAHSSNYDFNDGADKNEIRRMAINGGTLKNSPDGNNGGVLFNFTGSHGRWNTQLYNSQKGTMWYRSSSDAYDVADWQPWKMVSLYEDSIPTLLNGWEFWSDSNHGKVFSRQGNFGCVSLLVKKSTSDDMTVIAKTPFKPQKRIITTAFCNGKCIECRLEANGEIRLTRVGYVSNEWLNINFFYPIKFYNI